METTKTTTSKLAFIIGRGWDTTKFDIDALLKQGLDVHVLSFGHWKEDYPESILSLITLHKLKEPAAQGMDCIGPVLTAVNYGFELAQKKKKNIHSIMNTLTEPNFWNFDTTLENWKKIFWFQWDHKEHVNDVVVRTWNSIKPKPQPIKAVEESTEE
jgi:hypothetical protein